MAEETNGMGDALRKMVEGAPLAMSEMMREFIEKKDVASRVRLKLRIKALLDLVSVDTTYPQKTAAETGRVAIGVRPMVPGLGMDFPPLGDVMPYPVPQASAVPEQGGVALVPGAGQVGMDNADLTN